MKLNKLYKIKENQCYINLNYILKLINPELWKYLANIIWNRFRTITSLYLPNLIMNSII